MNTIDRLPTPYECNGEARKQRKRFVYRIMFFAAIFGGTLIGCYKYFGGSL